MLAHQSKYSCAVQMDQTGCKEGWNHEALMHNIASKLALKSMKLPYGMLSGCIFHPHGELLWFLSTHLLWKCHRWLFFQGVPLTKVHVQTTCHTSVLRSSRLTKSPNQTWFQSKQHYCQCSKRTYRLSQGLQSPTNTEAKLTTRNDRLRCASASSPCTIRGTHRRKFVS